MITEHIQYENAERIREIKQKVMNRMLGVDANWWEIRINKTDIHVLLGDRIYLKSDPLRNMLLFQCEGGVRIEVHQDPPSIHIDNFTQNMLLVSRGYNVEPGGAQTIPDVTNIFLRAMCPVSR